MISVESLQVIIMIMIVALKVCVLNKSTVIPVIYYICIGAFLSEDGKLAVASS